MEFCFGDFYTRDGLTMAQRGLLVLCALGTIGDTAAKLGPHGRACIQVGNSKAIVAALVHCFPSSGSRAPLLPFARSRTCSLLGQTTAAIVLSSPAPRAHARVVVRRASSPSGLCRTRWSGVQSFGVPLLENRRTRA